MLVYLVLRFNHDTINLCRRDLLFGSIYDTFSGEDDLSKTVFLEYLCRIITGGKLTFLRTVVAKDFIGMVIMWNTLMLVFIYILV